MNVACLFGTFDPPHEGHLHIARRVLDTPGIDRVWLVVTPRNPFKAGIGLSADAHRLAMVRLAVQGERGLEACDAELPLPPPNYTSDTLAQFRAKWPGHRFALVMGSDNLERFREWKDPEGILAHHRLLVHPRPGHVLPQAPPPFTGHPSITLLDGPVLDVSSTRVRGLLRAGGDAQGLLPEAVASYIAREGLYRD